jgi:hypothetical protein
MKRSDTTVALFNALRESAKPGPVNAIENAHPDAGLIASFVVSTSSPLPRSISSTRTMRLRLFFTPRDLAFSISPGTSFVPLAVEFLDSGATLKTVRQAEYRCALCARGCEPTLDEIVEVTFTISPRVRKIAAHDPETLPWIEYYRQIFWSSGVDLPDDETFAKWVKENTLDSRELSPGEKVVLSLQLPEGEVDMFDPVLHMSQHLEVKGQPSRESQSLSFVMTRNHAPEGSRSAAPRPFDTDNGKPLKSLHVAGRLGR